MSKVSNINCDYAGHEMDYWVDFWYGYLIRLAEQRDGRLYRQTRPAVAHASQGWTLDHEGMSQDDLERVAFALRALADARRCTKR